MSPEKQHLRHNLGNIRCKLDKHILFELEI
jgi:hypothetical protein